MKHSTKLLKNFGSRYNFTNSFGRFLPFAGAAVAGAVYLQHEKSKAIAPTLTNLQIHQVDLGMCIPFKTSHAAELSQSASESEYQKTKKELQESLSKSSKDPSAGDFGDLGILTFLKENLSDNTLYILDILNELGYNPLSYNEALVLGAIEDLYEQDKIDLISSLEKLKSFETKECRLADALSEAQLLATLITQYDYEMIETLIRLGYLGKPDARKYELYQKFVEIRFPQEEVLDRLSGAQVTDVDHLFGPLIFGICTGISTEFLRYHIKHNGDGTTEQLNHKFIAKAQNLSSDSTRLKRTGIYQNTLQSDLVQYHPIRRELLHSFTQLAWDQQYAIDSNANTISNILSNPDQQYFFVASKEHAIAVIKKPGIISDTFYIFDPNFGVFKVTGTRATLEIVQSLILEDSVCIIPMHQELQRLGFIASANTPYNDKDSKNTYKLLEALCSTNIAEIERLSKIQNISAIGYNFNLSAPHIDPTAIDNDVACDIVAQNMLLTPNTIAFAMQSTAVNEEALFALITNSSSLDITDTVTLAGILARLLTYDNGKASDRVIDALISHTSNIEARKYLEMTKTALRESAILSANLQLADENVIVDLEYDPQVESAAKIVELLDYNIGEIDRVYWSMRTEQNAGNKMVHFVAKVISEREYSEFLAECEAAKLAQ